MLERQASVDLGAYCERIGYTGGLSPTLETLRNLQAHHVAAIPFENIDVLLDREIELTPQAIDTKLIVGRRGGYCFEQNSLFKRVLEAIGFEVVGLLARVQWMSMPESPPSPRTHMALRVIVGGRPWLADVGFGGNVPAAPLVMDSDLSQPTPHGTYRLVPIEEELQLQTRLERAWVPLYQLSLQPQLAVDYELPNWYTSTHPSSHFRHQLSVALTTPQARYALKNARLSVRLTSGEETQRWLGLNELEATLDKTFGLPVSSDWSTVIERAVAAKQGAGL